MNQLCPGISAMLCIILSFCYTAQAQEAIENISIQTKDEYVQITYDLQAKEAGLLFNITPYYLDSLGERHPMRKVDGDTGHNIEKGKKQIQWYYHRELNNYQGDLKVELAYEVVAPKVAIPLDQQEYRRASKLVVSNQYAYGSHYEIVNTKRKKVAEGNLIHKGQAQSLKIPAKLALTDTYRLRVWTDAQAPPLYTSDFKVKRRIPWLLRAVGAGLILGATYYILQPNNDELPLPFYVPD